MNYSIKNLLTVSMLIAGLIMAACSTSKDNTTDADKDTIRGEVQEIQRGRDGYTATIKTTEGNLYYATISIPNLDDPKQFKEVSKGETIEVQGDIWKMEEQTHVTVRKLVIH